MKLKLHQVGEPVLRQVAQPLTIAEIRSASIQQLIEFMRETMQDAPGVGLAAPQVGMPLQLAVIEDRPEYVSVLPKESLAERERVPVPFQVIINPKLTVVEETPVEFFEGCLSLKGFQALVARARVVHVECLNERGKPTVIEAYGWHARILQHEIDHLQGRLYIDRMVPRSFMSSENYLRYWQDKSDDEIRAALGLALEYHVAVKE
jgi:peptide deformylase